MIDVPSFFELSEVRKEIERLHSLLARSERECCRLRLKLGIRRRNLNAKSEIFQHMGKGLRNCEIEKIGYAKSTIKLCRAAIKKAAVG